jgi:hypothetical protein
VIPQEESIAQRQSAQRRRVAAPLDRLTASGAARTGFLIEHCDIDGGTALPDVAHRLIVTLPAVGHPERVMLVPGYRSQ